VSHEPTSGAVAGSSAALTLRGAAAVVTGSSTGIGRAIALALVRSGADVAISYRTGESDARALAQEVQSMGRHAAVYRLDLADPASIAALAAGVHRDFGHVDIWVNNAGADILTGSVADLPDLAKLDLLLTVDLRGTVLASWEAARLMRQQPHGGVIINMSWDHVLSGLPGLEAQLFSAVKGGILAFSKSLARTVAPRVRVNVLAPGWIETAYGNEVDETIRRQVVASTPLERWGTPEDVAGAAVYLASRAASFVTGQTMLVGGGVVM